MSATRQFGCPMCVKLDETRALSGAFVQIYLQLLKRTSGQVHTALGRVEFLDPWRITFRLRPLTWTRCWMSLNRMKINGVERRLETIKRPQKKGE
ncbi:hypothetical protein cypCar_00015051 [Cyprinus carpio]|nr:hypothetical protein cypCar_00015051 [Cyprinus carpio]